MDRYFIDFETKSSLDITKVGAMKYLHTPQSDIICMSWALNPPPYGAGKVNLWLPKNSPSWTLFAGQHKVYTYNALFEYRVWRILGEKYSFPHLPLANMVDVQALCGRYTFPQKLEHVAEILETRHKKDPRGKALMKKITQPPFKYTKEELREFYAYCIRDTETMIDVVNALPSDCLSDHEQKVWMETQRINLRGVPVDVPLVKRIWAVANHYRDKKVKTIPGMTDGKVRNVTQTQAVRDYCEEEGYSLPNLQKDTVITALGGTLPDKVRDILTLRLDLAKSSIAKYEKLLSMVYNGRLYDNLRYHRATTGRWGGMDFQMHNLPNASVVDIEATIKAFYDLSILKQDVMHAASALIRPSLKAPDKFKFAVADYTAIENVLIAWVAGEEKILDLHRKGLSEYIDFATELYGVKYNDVTKEQKKVGKVIILGAGYNLGGKGLVTYAEGWGIEMTQTQGREGINKYRSTHKKIKGMWYALRDGAINAILKPGELFVFPEYKGTSFQCLKDRTGREWLILTLPSGRNLYYADPAVREDTFGLLPVHMGLNSKTHKWQRLKLIPGRITENIIQALARDILAHAKLQLAESGYDVVLSVHDEIVDEYPDYAEDTLRNIIGIMCTNPPWCASLPLGAEGVTTRRYYKI